MYFIFTMKCFKKFIIHTLSCLIAVVRNNTDNYIEEVNLKQTELNEIFKQIQQIKYIQPKNVLFDGEVTTIIKFLQPTRVKNQIDNNFD